MDAASTYYGANVISISRIISKIFQAYWRYSRGLELSVQAVVKNDAGLLMLVDDGGGAWSLLGGPVLAGESADVAVRRVLLTQAGVDPGRSVQFAGICQELADSGVVTRHIVTYSLTISNVDIGRGYEGSVGWFSLDALPDQLAESGAVRLAVET